MQACSLLSEKRSCMLRPVLPCWRLQLWADLEAAGNAHLAAVRAHESSSSDDEELTSAEEDDAAAATSGGLRRKWRSTMRMLDNMLRSSKHLTGSSMVSGASGSAAAAGAMEHAADSAPSPCIGKSPCKLVTATMAAQCYSP